MDFPLNCQVLECYELQPNNKVFLELIPIFPKVYLSTSFILLVLLGSFWIYRNPWFANDVNILQSHASHILGFKFQYYQRMEVNSPVPFSLYKLTALLVKEEFIDLDSM